MKELIEQIRFKANSIPTNTKENRRAKGAYVDCLIMAEEAKGQSELLISFAKWWIKEQPITCDHNTIVNKYLKNQ